MRGTDGGGSNEQLTFHGGYAVWINHHIRLRVELRLMLR